LCGLHLRHDLPAGRHERLRINSIARDISLIKIYRGTMPFIASDLIRLVIPGISLFLPRLFGG
jgi:hypothetical protein